MTTKVKFHVITYTLTEPKKFYKPLFEAIKKAKNWCHYVDSTWIIKSQYDSAYWADVLLPHIYETDTLMIIEVNVKDVHGYLPENAWKWINKNLL